MRVENLIGGDPAREKRQDRINEIFRWVAALDAFDYDDAEPLRALVANEPIPIELRPALAAIVAGTRKPNKKAAVKLKVPAADRMKVAGTLSAVLGLIDILKFGDIGDFESGADVYRRAIEIGAERRRREPIDELRDLEADARRVIEDAAKDLGVSVETIESLLRDLRKKLESFPDV